MKNLVRNRGAIFVILTIICLLVGFNYRNKNYNLYPPVSDTFDEFAVAWNGLSLLRSGIPTSWSYIPDYAKGIPKGARLDLIDTNIWVNGVAPTYKNYKSFPKPILLTRELTIEGFRSHFNIVSPNLEQPPLGQIAIAMPAFLSGVKKFEDVNLSTLRRPFVYLSVLSTLVLIVFANAIFGKKIALLAGILYATVPTIVIGSRLALPENILVLIILLQMICLLKNSRIAYLISFIAPLIKPFGLACSLTGAGYFLVIKNDKRRALNFLIVGAVSFSTYILYGLLIDKNTFWAVLAYQSSRFFAGPHVFLLKILVPRITKIFLDGWIVFGWISIFVLAFSKNRQKYALVILPVVSYALVLSFFGGEDYGWYRMPFYPFLILASALVIWRIIKSLDVFAAVLFLFLVFLPNLSWGLGIYNWSSSLFLFRIVLLGLTALLLIKRTRMIVLVVILVFSVFINTRISNNIGEVWPYLGDDSSLVTGRK